MVISAYKGKLELELVRAAEQIAFKAATAAHSHAESFKAGAELQVGMGGN